MPFRIRRHCTDLHLTQDIFGAKLRLAGDAVLDSDSWMPQVAAGLQYNKQARSGPLAPVLESFGAKDRQNKLPAKLAPMHRDIINTPSPSFPRKRESTTCRNAGFPLSRE